MLQIGATLLCALLGWKRLRFIGWPVTVIVATLVIGLVMLWRAWPPGSIATARYIQTGAVLAVLPLLAYVLAFLIRVAIDRTRNLPPD